MWSYSVNRERISAWTLFDDGHKYNVQLWKALWNAWLTHICFFCRRIWISGVWSAGLPARPGDHPPSALARAVFLYSGCTSYTWSFPTQVAPHCRQEWAVSTQKRSWRRSQVILCRNSLPIHRSCSLLNVSFSKWAFVSAGTRLGWRPLLFQPSGPIKDRNRFLWRKVVATPTILPSPSRCPETSLSC